MAVMDLMEKLLPEKTRDAWEKRQGRRIESNYLQAVVSAEKTYSCTSINLFKSRPQKLLYIANVLWEPDSLIPELQKLCEVTVLNLSPAIKGCSYDRGAGEVCDLMEQFIDNKQPYDPDVILLYARPQLLSEDLFRMIRKRWNCPLLGMNLDDKTEFLDYSSVVPCWGDYARWAGSFDLNLCSNLGALDLYEEHGLPVYYFPEGCAHNSAGPVRTVDDYQHQITFSGAMKQERREMINYLKSVGINVHTFGRGWPQSEWVSDLNELFRNSQINLGIGSAAPAFNLSHLKGRDIECPAAGACYLTSYNWELANLYELNKEILCYRNMEELVEMLAYYSKRPELCLRIAEAGYKRCMTEHTWEVRFRKLFQETGFVQV